MFAPTLAPSAVPIKVGNGYLDRLIGYLAWAAPKEMTTQDVERVIRQFVDTARLLADAGFSGIELHGAHGYLIGMSFSNLPALAILVLNHPCIQINSSAARYHFLYLDGLSSLE